MINNRHAGRPRAPAGASGGAAAGAGEGGDAGRLALLGRRLPLRVRLRLLPLPLLPLRRRLPPLLGGPLRPEGPFTYDVRKVFGILDPLPLVTVTITQYNHLLLG